jgi:hypothetical protein
MPDPMNNVDDQLAELRQQVADLAELTVTMRHRENLPHYRRAWNEDRDVEERLVARIKQWAQSSQDVGGAQPRDEYQDVVEAARGGRLPDPPGPHSPRSRASVR